MTLMARYPGECPECGERWRAGDYIRADEGEREWKHAVCPDAIADRLIHPVCQVCWLTHPAGVCDR